MIVEPIKGSPPDGCVFDAVYLRYGHRCFVCGGSHGWMTIALRAGRLVVVCREHAR